MSAFYNEHDPRAAAWLRELIADGLIPPGVVDTRSIVDLKPEDLYGFTQVHFFAGIGGWPLALQLAGWPTTRPICSCSCPCQPFSGAGLGLGEADERHLWPVAFNLIRACGFPIIIGEQVASKAVVGGSGAKAGRVAKSEAEFTWIDRVFADLEGAHFSCAAVDIPAAGIGEKAFAEQAGILRRAVACGHPGTLGREREVLALADWLDGLLVGAPHIRQRLFWVGIANGTGRDSRQLASEAPGHGRSSLAASDALGLAIADNAERGPDLAGRNERDRTETGRNESHGQSGERGEAESERVAITGSQPAGRELQRPGESAGSDVERASDQSGGPSDTGGVALTSRAERRRRRGIAGSNAFEASDNPSGASVADHWSDFSIIPCRDGKARRIPRQLEPDDELVAHGLSRLLADGWSECDAKALLEAAKGFPLAKGVKGRVGLLRGAGNSINPFVGAEFIKACMDVIDG